MSKKNIPANLHECDPQGIFMGISRKTTREYHHENLLMWDIIHIVDVHNVNEYDIRTDIN